MDILYLTTDEVNADLAARMAKKCRCVCETGSCINGVTDVTFDAVLCDLDHLPEPERTTILGRLLATRPSYPTGVHSYNLDEVQTKTLVNNGIEVSRRLNLKVFRALRAAYALLTLVLVTLVPFGLASSAVGGESVKQSAGTFTLAGKAIKVEHFEPTAPGPYPVVIMLYGKDGLNGCAPVFRAGAKTVAQEGYVVLLVHYFDRIGVARVGPEDIKANFRAWMDTIAATVPYAAKLPGADAKRIGLLGFSLGACLSLALAAEDKVPLMAVVDWFGYLPDEFKKCCKRLPPTLIVHGGADKTVPVEKAKALECLLKDLNLTYEVKIYPKQEHIFRTDPFGPDACDARERTLAFLKTHLKKTPAAEAVGELRCIPANRLKVWTVAFCPDDRHAVSGGGQYKSGRPVDCDLILWDLETGRLVRRFVGHTGPVYGAAISPDGRWVASVSRDQTMQLWDLATGKELFRGPFFASVRSIAFSKDGTSIVTGDDIGKISLWDSKTGKDRLWFDGHFSNCCTYSVAFSPDGKRIASASQDGTARVWEARSGREVCRFCSHRDWVTGVAFTPDGRYLLSSGDNWDRTVRLWDLQSGQEVRQFRGHRSGVQGISVSPDGSRLLSAGADRTVRLWDIKSGRELHCFRGHSAQVTSVAFSPDGRRAISGSVDGTVRLWGLPKETLPQPPAVAISP
jgi:WD40 repeat protein